MGTSLGRRPLQNESFSHRILGKIQESYETLRNSEKKVAQYVIENPQRVIYQSITDLTDSYGMNIPIPAQADGVPIYEIFE